MFKRLVFSGLQNISLFNSTLLSVELLDEVISGFPVVGIALIRDQLRLSYTQVGLLFTVGACAAMVLEPVINLWSDRGSKRAWILGGLLVMALGFVMAGQATNFAMLLLAFVLIGPAGVAVVGLSQAVLIDQCPQESTRTMTRWTLMGSIGDMLAPLSVTLIVSMHLGWSALCWLAAILWLGVGIVLWPQHFPGHATTADDGNMSAVKLLEGLREALRDPELLRWGVLSLIPTMVDEVFLGFAVLYLRDVFHANAAIIGIIITINMLGAMCGLFVLDRLPLLRRIEPHRLLAGMAVLVLVGMIDFLSTRVIWCAALALFVISLGAAGWYPIAKAQAYAQLPGRAGMVRAVVSLGAPFEMALPGIVGLIAGQFGLLAGVGFLGLAPIFVLILTLGYKKK